MYLRNSYSIITPRRVYTFNSNLPLQVWDFPGQIDFFDPAFDSEVLFGNCGALVFVIDAQVLYMYLNFPSGNN